MESAIIKMNNIISKATTSALMNIPALSLNKPKTQKYTETDCKDIVVWGTNLGLTIKFGSYSKQVRGLIDLPQFQFSTIIGLYLSDGSSSLSLVRYLSSTPVSLEATDKKV
jgi:hypothetical protein